MHDDKPQVDLRLSPYVFAMCNDFELYNVYAESTEIEKWPMLNTKIVYVGYNGKELSSNRVKFSSTEGKCQKGYDQRTSSRLFRQI